MIAMRTAVDVPDDRFSAMTRLDQNRAQAQLAMPAVQLRKRKPNSTSF